MSIVQYRVAAGGIEAEKCEGCKRRFKRGAQMNAVVYANDDSVGWFCDSCVTQWAETGIQPDADGGQLWA